MYKDLEKEILKSIPPIEELNKSAEGWYKKYQTCQKKGHIQKKILSKDPGRGIVRFECKRCGKQYTRRYSIQNWEEWNKSKNIPTKSSFNY